MRMRILGLGTATPGEPIAQTDLFELARLHNATGPAERTRLKRIYRGTKVAQRHSVLSLINNATPGGIQNLVDFFGRTAREQPLSTRRRMAVYREQALPLAERACREALRNSRAQPADITHLVTVSCTGFDAPGVDLGLIDALGLASSVARTHIGFMGCHGAVNALRVADAFARTDPAARVLICCVELCTLHFQYGSDAQDAVANAIFADGAAAAVCGVTDDTRSPIARSFFSKKIEATESLMAWAVGDEGFRMRLDSRVPGVVQSRLRGAIGGWLETEGYALQAITGWVIHPGGPKIIDAVQAALDLPADATALSRAVLRDFGNMSSPTVLFILERHLRRSAPGPWVVLAFGPGLVIEAALIG
jgi:predicted naringenin-chalcone synthase